MKVTLVFIFSFFFYNCFSQGLSIERVNKIKGATVRINIDNTNAIGTGFFINKDGVIASCWHVIEPSIKRNAAGNIISFNKISVTIDDTSKLEYLIPVEFFNDTLLYQQAVSNDFVVLFPSQKIMPKYFLKLGDFNTLIEGQEVITCGYPIGIQQKFISKGIVSTKYVDTTLVLKNANYSKKVFRNQALVDITMNRGNSGGAVIVLGNSIEDDYVVGIASFIINPIANLADSFIKQFDSRTGSVVLAGTDPNEVFSTFTKILSSTSIGVSGFVSINYLKSILK